MQAAPTPPPGVVPLSHKRRPTEILVQEDPTVDLVCATTRASQVDIAELKRQIVSLPESRWSEEYQSTSNVSLRRPFHDKVGVNKIICIFSDNHLENVYLLPEWTIWRPLLEPLFAAIDVPVERVVRCLFARLPPKVLIPAHHDNGPWVGRTHRIHVPIVTFPEVEFKSGRLEESMSRFAFNEGSIVELNNAAKHSVYNGADEYRVHLIFDVIDELHVPTPLFATLEAGQRCRQVRGRVELISATDELDNSAGAKIAASMLTALTAQLKAESSDEAATTFATACRHFFIEQIDAMEFATAVRATCPAAVEPMVLEMLGHVDRVMAAEAARALRALTIGWTPSYAILGVQKCGTTSLYQHLGQHPSIVNGQRREPHFFDWAWTKAATTPVTDELLAPAKAILQTYDDLAKDATVTDDETTYSTLDMRAKYLLSLQAPLETWAPKILLAESTPSYLLYGAPIAKRFQQLFPHTRFIVMMRDPVKRAYSHYQMTADAVGTTKQLEMRAAVAGKSFDDVINDDLALLQVSIYPCCNTFEAYVDRLPKTHGAHSYIGRGLYALQLQIWFQHFPRNQFLLLNLDALKTPESTQTTVNEALTFLGLPPHVLQDTAAHNTRAYDPMPAAAKAKLEAFYAPFNAHLRSLAPSFDFTWSTQP
ncbi:hypothetical protein SDRG_13619 [Saprolegnia diclina VS20]|uniref:Aspartyl/asparaginy/proline hydroxylase domain-containing protein n=1 Tax=Saprolegnia diclina (strain VS20) TaxID=1156394 RepID=T0Q1X8_SAPDV|nr:hypothetical protein SDRG_13619 [Saprolegnia diclina VS20]EQC28541.1 hypothetical protein SDRG_13619 [Saprolegnia diclina VS20]|eukprot:XP_008617938.1 hypothetical protein SDRG_13619 [Saprolegnia diclina VS20]